MDESSKISSIMEPVRSLVLAGGSMKQNRNAFVVVHVKKYIVEEKREILRETKRLQQQNTDEIPVEIPHANGVVATPQELAEQNPALQEPAAQELAEQNPVVQEPAAQELAEQNPVVQEPAAQELAEQNPALQEPATQEPAAQEPAAVEDPAEQEPATQERIILDVQAAEFAVRDWEEQAADLINLINENKENDILSALDAALELKSVCMESIVFCLVLVIKKTRNVEMKAKGYSKVPLYCKTTEMLMLFIEYFKIYNITAGIKSGWGRGFKKAILKWYLEWTPKELALEVTRYPHAYSWSHKDVLKMAHIKLHGLGVEHAVVLHYIFSGYESARDAYEDDPRAEAIFASLKTIHEGAKEISNHEVIIARGNDIKTAFRTFTLRDFPMQAINSVEVLTFLLEQGDPNLIIDLLINSRLIKYAYTHDALCNILKGRLNQHSFSKKVDVFQVALAFNATRRVVSEFMKYNVTALNPLTLKRKTWMKFAQPSAERAKKNKTPHPRQKEIDDLFKALSKNITRCTENMKKHAPICPIVFIDFDAVLEVYIPVDPGNFVSKQLRGTQAISYLLLVLLKKKQELNTLIPTSKEVLDKFAIGKAVLGFDTLLSALNDTVKKIVRIDVKSSLETAIAMEKTTALLIYSKLTAEILKDVFSKFKEVEKSNPTKTLKLIVLGVNAQTQNATVEPYDETKILLLYGFTRFTPAVIQAFTNGLL